MKVDVLIDGFSQRYGGGVTYLAGLLPALAEHPSVGRVKLLAEPRAAVVRELAGGPVETELVSLRPRGSVPPRVLWEALALPRRVRKWVVLAPAAMLPRRLAAPVVAVPHNALPFEVAGTRTSLQRWSIVRTLRWATAAIFVTDHMRRLVAARAALPPLHRVIPHGLRPEFLEPWPEDRPRHGIVCVADTYSHKRLDLLVEAWRGLGRGRPPLRLIGRRLDRAPSPEPALTLESDLSGADVVGAVRGAAVAVLPSARESFGLPALEALACRTPLIASDIPAYREVTGGHAQFISSDRAEAWSAAIARFLGDPPDVDAGYRWARRFTWSRCADETTEVLRAARDAFPTS